MAAPPVPACGRVPSAGCSKGAGYFPALPGLALLGEAAGRCDRRVRDIVSRAHRRAARPRVRRSRGTLGVARANAAPKGPSPKPSPTASGEGPHRQKITQSGVEPASHRFARSHQSLCAMALHSTSASTYARSGRAASEGAEELRELDLRLNSIGSVRNADSTAIGDLIGNARRPSEPLARRPGACMVRGWRARGARKDDQHSQIG
jgi:hypothetical protein